MKRQTRTTPQEILDHIRIAEAEASRQIEEANTRAEQIRRGARQEAERLRQEGQLNGRRLGQIRYEQDVDKAREEANELVKQAEERVGAIQAIRDEILQKLVEVVVARVAGLSQEEQLP